MTTKTTKKYEALKKSFDDKNITYYTINVDGEEFYISDISRNTLKKTMTLLETKPIPAFQIILKDIFLGGDKNVLTDTNLFLAAMPLVLSLIEPYPTTFKKLENGNFKITIKRSVKTSFECELKPMTIGVLGEIFGRYNKGDTIGALEILFDKCWVNGDKNIITNNKLFLSAMPVFEQMIQVKTGNIKKN